MNDNINWIAAIVAGILGYFPGALWYSPALFVKPWARELGIDLTSPPTPKHGKLIIPIGMAISLVTAIIFAHIVGSAPALGHALLFALACAGGLVATSFAIQYLYEGRSLTFWAINAGYHLLQFSLFAIVLALWP
jgi:hypothetical protein